MTRSRNNNMFRFSSYFLSWSRILFHDAGGYGMEQMRKRYDIPKSIKSIEIEITTVGGSASSWQGVAKGNIHCHSSDFNPRDLFRGGLDQAVLTQMQLHLPERTIEVLLHADLLCYLDFDKYDKYNNGGAAIKDIVKDFPTLEQYYAQQINNGGGPGLLLHDVEDDWYTYSNNWAEKIQQIIP